MTGISCLVSPRKRAKKQLKKSLKNELSSLEDSFFSKWEVSKETNSTPPISFGFLKSFNFTTYSTPPKISEKRNQISDITKTISELQRIKIEFISKSREFHPTNSKKSLLKSQFSKQYEKQFFQNI